MKRLSVKRYAVNLLLFVGSSVLTLLLLEAGLRLAGISFPSSFYRLDEYTGVTHRPNAEGWYRKEGKAFIRINSQGLRDREHSKEKPPDILRIAILGDSYAEAVQMPMETTFWAVLERELNSNCPFLKGQTTEVINFGVSGYGTAQELLALRHRVWDYEPDIIVLAFLTGNDIRNNSRALQKNPRKPYFVFEDGQLVLDDSFLDWQKSRKLYYWMLGQSRVFQVVHEVRGRITQIRLSTSQKVSASGTPAVPSTEAGLDDMVYREPLNPVWQEAWQITEDLIILMRDEIVAREAEFFIVTLSNSIQVHPDPTVRQQFMEYVRVESLFYPDLRLKALGEREGIPVLNLAPAFQQYAEQHKVFLHGFGEDVGYGHWNETGHRLAGEMIAQKLCTEILGP